ncbi:MAG: sigma factor-like helix-turn-helix DNA-binding protein [Candidatus Berkelbacteria bacterium]|nr:sigma factor-like helix-turn-helix DNA-binding protein [Candidatus Berkelbacteria bacterium]
MGRIRVALLAKMKQADLWEALQKRNWSQKQGADFVGMRAGKFGEMLNLTAFPKFTPELDIKLFELTGKFAEELFPQEFRTREFLEQKKVFTAIGSVGPAAISSSGVLSLPPRDIQEMLELRIRLLEVLGEGLDTLTSREREVFSLKYGLNGDLLEANVEIATKLGITKTRVEQLDTQAVKKLKDIARRKSINWK